MRFISELISILKSKRIEPRDTDLLRWAEIEFKNDSGFAYYNMKRGIFNYEEMKQ
jgi:hypothetical protein